MENTDAQYQQDQPMEEVPNGQEHGEGMEEQHEGEKNSHLVGKDEEKKLFVGALSWETTEKDLREHFSKYGEIEGINIKVDPVTGRSRGFAFINFKTPSALDDAIKAGEHVINSKKVDVKKAKARTGKIFVGGLVPEISDDDIKAYFGQFGNIVEVELPFDKTKNQRKAFCFITFDDEKVANELVKKPKQTIKDKEVDVKKATPKEAMMMPPMRGGRGGPRGMLRGMRGGAGMGRGGAWGAPGSFGYGGGYGGYGGGYGYDAYGGAGYDYYGSGYGGGYGSGYEGYGYNGGYGGYSGPARGGKARGTRGGQRHAPY
ncbi:heterogeneous nuclear ribonucleoprotein A/B-like [Artemia franciscana]|uniref:heterogeneous nuclear ribonucleoprotein A/B-like n=1 Tax=Artemia franciscana TaxID=6661 RepID=UPI0032D9FC25